MGYTLISTVDNVASGKNVSLTWPGLTDNMQYSWYVVVSNGIQSVTSDVWNFTTGGQTLTVSKSGTRKGLVTSDPV